MRDLSEKFFASLKEYENDAVDDLPLHPSQIKPDWYDSQLFARGQQFAQKHYSSIRVSELVSTYFLFTLTEILGPLVYTRRSDTVEAATKRYYSTVMRVHSWYESDPWDRKSEAYRNIIVVRSLHSKTSRILNSRGRHAVAKEIDSIKALWPGGCPAAPPILESSNKREKFITQPEMTTTLFAFMGLALLYPEKFGIFHATDDDLTAFVHFWRTIGHLMGVKDEINFCRGSLDEVKDKCRLFMQTTVLPNMSNLNKNWEHMSKCMILGGQSFLGMVDFDTTLLYFFWVLDLKCDKLKKNASFASYFKFRFYLFVVQYLQRFSLFEKLLNFYIRRSLLAFGKSETFRKLKNL